MKVSLVTTCLNEQDSIDFFLNSLLRQTSKPYEVIIVDAGSSDRTVERIKYKILSKKNIKFKVFIKIGNRSTGRNFGIKKATGDIIAVTDVGCILDKNWLRNIVEPFKNKKIDIVAGFYKPKTETIFERCLATYTCTMPDKVDPENFLPSSRSVAFRKIAWKQGGGYPEELETCEDLVFDKRLKHMGAKFFFAKHAFVYWPQRKNIIQAFFQFFSYAKGDGQAFYLRPQTPLLFTRYIVGFCLIVLAIISNSKFLFTIIYLLLALYIFWSIYKNYRYVKDIKGLIYLPVLQFTSDLAVISGFLVGLVLRK